MTSADASAGGGGPSPADRVRRTVLPNGLRILTDEQPDRASVAISAWVAVGSRDEPAPLAGASHFLEHLLFKGTAERDAKSIALAIDGVGGEMNAFTANEHTAFYTRVSASDAHVAVDLLLDVLERPLLAAREVDSERQVILEELAAADDDPDDVVSVRLFEALFPGHPLGRETLGTVETIESLGRDDIAAFFERWYQPANLVFAAAGNIDHDVFVDEVQRRFGGRAPGEAPQRVAPDAAVVATVVTPRPGELAHLALGWRAPGINDPDRFALALLNHVFGGGPSSHLFQEIREARGLTYSVGSEVSQHVDAGALTVHCATAPAKASQLLELVDLIVGRLAVRGLDREELARAKGALRGGLVMGFESPAARMTRLGVGETMRGGVTPIGEHLARLEAVTVEDVQRVAARVFGSARSLSLVGPEGFELPPA